VDALRQVREWPVERVAAGVVRTGGARAAEGDETGRFPWASVTKTATALAVLVAAEEGILELDDPAGPEGATVRHLLAHASGLPLYAGAPIAQPGARRIYSNHGFVVLAEHLAAAAAMPFPEYLHAAVLAPLGLRAELRGDAGSGLVGSLGDLLALGAELLEPTLVAPETLAEAVTVQFEGLTGVLPGFGRQERNDWGLGFELRDAKKPHWTGARNSPRTFGHFGRSGTFLWVDPVAQVTLGVLTDREFGDWAHEAWPALADAVLGEATSATSPLA
jgi:CubicO group peptidase (beta-lactamase class C family)